jgi:hypothetical protein
MIGKQNNLKVFGGKYIQVPTHGTQNQLWSPIPEENLSFINNCIIYEL